MMSAKQGSREAVNTIFQVLPWEMNPGLYEADSLETTHSPEMIYLFNIISHYAGYNIEMGCGVSFF